MVLNSPSGITTQTSQMRPPRHRTAANALVGGADDEEATMAVAAYARIAEDLRGRIASRNIKPGGPLPSELELRDEYGASRNTVLDAIKKLKDEGLVETRPGQGWFARVRIVPFVNSIDWADDTAIEQARARGRVPTAAPPTVNVQPAPIEMAERLRVPVGTEMIVRRQEWFLEELPWKVQTAWCPKARYDQGAHRLLIAEDIPEGLGAYLQGALDLRPAGTKFYFLPRKPSGSEISFFCFPDESDVPYVIELVRTACMADDDGARPLYAAVGIYAGDRNRFESSRSALPSERPLASPSGTS
jgi:GntR family transcriptional regulator